MAAGSPAALGGGTFGVHSAPRGHACALLSQPMVTPPPAGRSPIMGTPRTLARARKGRSAEERFFACSRPTRSPFRSIPMATSSATRWIRMMTTTPSWTESTLHRSTRPSARTSMATPVMTAPSSSHQISPMTAWTPTPTASAMLGIRTMTAIPSSTELTSHRSTQRCARTSTPTPVTTIPHVREYPIRVT